MGSRTLFHKVHRKRQAFSTASARSASPKVGYRVAQSTRSEAMWQVQEIDPLLTHFTQTTLVDV